MKSRGKRSANIDLVCFICDFWWLFLLILIVLVLLAMGHTWWSPGGGVATVPPVGEVPTLVSLSTPTSFLTPESTATVRSDIPTPESGWAVFRDEELGYQIEYPQAWFASPLTNSASPGGNAEESVLISNAANNSSAQSRTPDETARMWIVSHYKGEQSVADWVVANFSWIGGAANSVQIGGFPALQLETGLPDSSGLTYYMTWIDRGTTVLLLWGQYQTDNTDEKNVLDRIVFSLKFSP